MILSEDDLPWPWYIGQVSFKNYLPSKKIYLSQTTGLHFFWALLHHWTSEPVGIFFPSTALDKIAMFCFFKLQFFGAYDLIAPSSKRIPICDIFGCVKGENSDSHS